MAITFNCPHCSAALDAKDELAGKKANCPKCNKELTVPKKRNSRFLSVGQMFVQKKATGKVSPHTVSETQIKVLIGAMLLFAVARTGLSSPVREAPTKIIVEGVYDPDGDNSDPQYGLWTGVGRTVRERLIVGIYGSVTETDRRIPATMDRLWGIGGFYEYEIDFDSDWIPYFGSRVGILDPSGVNDPTVLHMTTLVGIKRLFTDSTSLSCAVNVHWVDEDIFDSKEVEATTSETDDLDLTVNIGVRFLL